MPQDPDNITRDVFSVGERLAVARKRARLRAKGDLKDTGLTKKAAKGTGLTKAQQKKVNAAIKSRQAAAEARKAKPKKAPSLAAQAAAGSFNARKRQIDEDVKKAREALRAGGL